MLKSYYHAGHAQGTQGPEALADVIGSARSVSDLRSHSPKFNSSELDDLLQSAAEDQEAIGIHFSKVRVVP